MNVISRQSSAVSRQPSAVTSVISHHLTPSRCTPSVHAIVTRTITVTINHRYRYWFAHSNTALNMRDCRRADRLTVTVFRFLPFGLAAVRLWR